MEMMEKLMELEHSFNQIRLDVGEVRQDLSEIKTALLGNEFNENGFAQRIVNAEIRVGGLEQYVNNEKDRVSAREKREKRFALYVGIAAAIITTISIFWSFNNKK